MSHLRSELGAIPSVVGGFVARWEGSVVESSLEELNPARVEAACRAAVSLARAARDAVGECGDLSCEFGDHRLQVLLTDFGIVAALVERAASREVVSGALQRVGLGLGSELGLRPPSRAPSSSLSPPESAPP